MLDKLFKKSKDTEASPAADASVPASVPASAEPKKSLYSRYQDAKRGKSHEISDADLLKYTGKTRGEINEWAKDKAFVAGNRPAGEIAIGPTSGLADAAAGAGFGGWGPNANKKLKFPPTPREEKKLEDEDDD